MSNMLPEYQVGVQRQSIQKTNINLALHDVPKQWVKTKGEGVRIGILDTGLPNHRDLNGKVIIAKNFTNSPVVDDLDGHSTHVCGIIAADSKDDNGLVGIAPKAELVIGKILNDQGAGADEWLAQGIMWCLEQKCDIINMSLGAPAKLERKFKRSKEAIEYAYSKNVYLFAASGNDGAESVNVPGRWNSVFCVGALDSNLKRAPFSNAGPEIDFSNIGTDVVSTYLDNSYAAISGTSQASPGIVGVAALILSEHKIDKNHTTPINNFMDMRDHLIRLCTDLGTTGHDRIFGWGNPVFGTPSTITPDDKGGLVPDPPPSLFGRFLNFLRL
jgi:subtilisin family serine protease